MIKTLSVKFIRPLVQNYLSKERSYRYQGLSLKILPGVFHPAFFFSTKFLLSYLRQFHLKKKSLLELGAGSGLISFVAEKSGADVTASDLSKVVIKGLWLNKEQLHSQITIIESDLFEKIPLQTFDFIIINPPYYSKKVESDSQLAWYCGEHHEYFEKLFSQLSERKSLIDEIVMVLSEDCDILTIRKIAEQYNFELKESMRKKIWWEWNFIFEIEKIPG